MVTFTEFTIYRTMTLFFDNMKFILCHSVQNGLQCFKQKKNNNFWSDELKKPSGIKHIFGIHIYCFIRMNFKLKRLQFIQYLKDVSHFLSLINEWNLEKLTAPLVSKMSVELWNIVTQNLFSYLDFQYKNDWEILCWNVYIPIPIKCK